MARAASTSCAPAGDGRVGYAPLILRPREARRAPGRGRPLDNTWQAYNFLDANGDGWGDSWYVSGATRAVDSAGRSSTSAFRFASATGTSRFISWLRRTGKQVDYLSDDDLERIRTGDELRRDYDLVVFPGHEEYVSDHVYDIVTPLPRPRRAS